jgi:type VI secretion system secreted protein Hcp
MNALSILPVILSGALLLGMKSGPGNGKIADTGNIVGTMEVKSAKQGMIAVRPGTGINLISFKMGSAAPVDPKSGGRKQHLIVITKEIDPASPKLFIAYNGNEVLSSVVFHLTQKTPDSRSKVPRTVTLTDVVISTIRRNGVDLNPQGSSSSAVHMEELSYSYLSILIQNTDGSTSTTDDVTANNQ